MLTVVINAGGESRRMGENKALKLFAGQILIARMVARVRPVADEIIVTTNHPADFAFLNLPLESDRIPGKGALSGLHAAIARASHAWVAVLACDMPFISAGLLAALRDVIDREGVDVVIPVLADGPEPLHAVYRKATCLPAIEAALAADQRKLISWFPSVRVREVSAAEIAVFDPHFYSFINVNTPEEFQQAELIQE
jgi:molybdenum cofactor guanylyltransferase